jgi:hypothetical protein
VHRNSSRAASERRENGKEVVVESTAMKASRSTTIARLDAEPGDIVKLRGPC